MRSNSSTLKANIVGLGNYIEAVTTRQTWDRLWNTAIFVCAAVTIEIVLGTGLALLLDRPTGRGARRGV